ncbi:MAG: dihydroorotate dehydrogenase [Clostridia bacterium]|nr:dihydroorotate dehydrogenase [Clostridia bacterium]
MSRLNVNICGVEFKNPVIAASGTYGFGREYNELYPISKLGGISSKGMTIHEKAGNPPPRIAETPSGILNSVGLQNPGVEHFIREDLPWLRQQNTVIIANIAGATEEDYAAIAEKINDSDVDMVELNISCPNVKAGGAAFGTSCAGAERITSVVRRHCPDKPLIVKLSPNVTSISEIAKAVEAAGADAVSLINTLLGMRIDIRTRRPILHNNKGGMSGAAIFPIAVRMVNEVYNAVKVPVIGLGGICTWKDAIEMTLAGASAIQVGTVMFTDPYAPLKIIEGMDSYLAENHIANISELVGQVELW